jgi:hypothetical protein
MKRLLALHFDTSRYKSERKFILGGLRFMIEVNHSQPAYENDAS